MKEKEMIYGIHAVMEAVEAGKDIDKVLLKSDMGGMAIRQLIDVLKGKEIQIQRVPQQRLDRFTRKNHQGVIAFMSAITYDKLANIIPFVYEQGKNPFIILLDGITDVRNFGAIARTCECAGVDAVVIPTRNSVTVNADAMKTSAGALNVLPVCRENSIKEAIQFLKDSGVRVFAATEKASDIYTDVSYDGPVAIVMGAEDKGVSYENLRICDQMIKIPQFGKIGSLNVSVATSVITYEVVRQQQLKAKEVTA